MNSRIILAAPLLILLSSPVWATPQTTGAAQAGAREDLPVARTVIDRHLELTGSTSVITTTTSTRTKGTLELVGMNIGGPMEVLSHKSNKRLVQVEMGAMGTVREGFDGTTAWSIQPGIGAQIQEGLEQLQTQLHANYTAALKSASDYESMKTLAKADFEGRSCWKLELIAKLPSGMDAASTKALRTTHEYYDVETGLLAGTEMTTAAAMPVVVVQSDYKKLGERLVATTVIQKAGPQRIKITTSSITYDDVEPAAFSLPAEISAKLEARNQTVPAKAK